VGKMRDMDCWYRENGVQGLVERRDKGLEGHISHGIAWIEGVLYLMSREKTSIVVEGKDQSCDCRLREEDCVTLALQSEA